MFLQCIKLFSFLGLPHAGSFFWYAFPPTVHMIIFTHPSGLNLKVTPLKTYRITVQSIKDPVCYSTLEPVFFNVLHL